MPTGSAIRVRNLMLMRPLSRGCGTPRRTIEAPVSDGPPGGVSDRPVAIERLPRFLLQGGDFRLDRGNFLAELLDLGLQTPNRTGARGPRKGRGQGRRPDAQRRR